MSRPPSLETLRGQIATLQAERDALTAQSKSRSEVASHIETTVDRWAAAGAGAILNDLQRSAAGQPCEPLSLRGPVLNMGPLLCAMLGADQVKRAILATLPGVPEGLDTAARLARIRELDSSLDDLETAEELLIVKSGGDTQRRANCRPEIVLGC